MKGKLNGRLFPYVLMVPVISFFVLVAIYPLVLSFRLSFFSKPLLLGGREKFVGFANYLETLQDPVFWHCLKTSIFYMGIAVTLQVFIGLMLALLLNRKELEKTRMLRSIFLLPLFMAPAAEAYIWRFMYSEQWGIIKYCFDLLGIPQVHWLTNPSVALFAIILVGSWRRTSFVLFIILAALQSIPLDAYEAAKVDGASAIARFRYLTLPILKPVILTVVLLRTIDSMKVFDMIFVLTGGGPGRSTETLNMLIYHESFQYFHLGKGASLSYVFLIIIMIISSFYILSLFKSERLGRS